ncbi:MAG TPA: OB-fold nucleic acid binding domain-containing protein, partial [Candidatus Saccharimonadales bacterium]|nr:OB-fold nucleic acid binding domain-containing protein [Candidatus Saccharimonadales bacterium]
MERTVIIDCLKKTGEEVSIEGWIERVRAHGKIAFADLRDRSGVLQIAAFDPEIVAQIAGLGSQDVVEIKGLV